MALGEIGGKAWMVNTQVLVELYQLLHPPLKGLGAPLYNSEHLLKWI